MDIKFCKYYIGDGFPPSNRYCRHCNSSSIACEKLWQLVLTLARSNNGEPISIPNTNARLFPNPNNENMIYLQVNCRWNLSKEDFLHFIATGHAGMGRANQRLEHWISPSLTRQEPYVNSIVNMLGGWNIPEVIAVKTVQK